MPDEMQVNIGYIPLTDCAALVVAREFGIFARHGLRVRLKRETSWANLRDGIVLGELDAAHMLAPMPLAITLGIAAPRQPVITAVGLALNGNAITLALPLHGRLRAMAPDLPGAQLARTLKILVDEDRRARRAPMTFAVVSTVSNHYYQLRHWLHSGGVDPDRDVQLLVVPPPRMVEALQAGKIVGYCVGEPWNSLAARKGVGMPIVGSSELWSNVLEKVLGVREAWARQHPETHLALIRSIVEAARILDSAAGRREAAPLVAAHIGVDPAVVELSLLGQVPGLAGPAPDFHVFHRYAANFPWRSHALWFLQQMRLAGQCAADPDARATAWQVYRPDIYREAMAAMGESIPLLDTRVMGTHATPWTLPAVPDALPMGPDLFFDGQIFDPERNGCAPE
ncbi:CmpA/NrtA family ABC transporter substrate-binding protein [Acidithiobacillus sp.]|uniref:CmpA/NrtA family ABC transporter substrate-binding protein n=1 Tax=Acidithiobacillus sp. TaxID=1872118 RepID=UPI003D058E2F